MDEKKVPDNQIPQRPDPFTLPDDTTYNANDFFGPAISEDFSDYEDQIPEEVKSFFVEQGLHERKFTCKLKEITDGITGSGEYIKSWTKMIPTEDFIAKNWGPGIYSLVFIWGVKRDNRQQSVSDQAVITISEKQRELYEQTQFERMLKKTNDNRRRILNAKLKGELEGSMYPGKSPETTEKSFDERMSEFIKFANMVGWAPPNRQVPSSPFNWEGITSILTAASPIIATVINKFGGSGGKMLDLLVSQMQQNSNNMLEMLKVQTGAGGGSNMMKEIKDMVVGSLDIKSALEGEKESTFDKVMETVSKIIPFLPIFMKQNPNPIEKMAQQGIMNQAKSFVDNDPTFQEILSNPEKFIEFIARLDKKLGWEQCDMILKLGGWERPLMCKRMPGFRYPEGDPKNRQELEEIKKTQQAQEPDEEPQDAIIEQ